MSQEPTASDVSALADALLQTRTMHDSPEAAVQRAIDIFATRPRRVAASLRDHGGLRLPAVLAFDSRHAAPSPALRSGTSAERKLLFCVDGCDLDLRIVRDVVGWQVSGQVLGPDGPGSVALQAGDFWTEAAWNSLCEFHLAGVPSGCWQVVLRADNWVMTLPDLQVPGEDG